MEGDVFRRMIPVISQAGELAEDSTKKKLEVCKTARSRSEIQDILF
ncbi:hypothetical protein G9F72_005380 [Clostridium estertheticum]|nr:hypothetical protein [Clostridium estertheticum]MBZ9685777.1 hypothetical protein [Clostridium estertheticum]